MILNKRIFRELKSNFFRYFALLILIMSGIGVIAGMAASVDSIIISTTDYQSRRLGEDGNFSVFVPIDEKNKNYLKAKGVILEENFYLDIATMDSSTLRVFKDREAVNLLEITDGSKANNNNEVVIEELYAELHDLRVGDNIIIGDKDYKISGLGCVPDYIFILKNSTDVAKDLKAFSLAFVISDEFQNLQELYSEKVEYNYSFIISDEMDASDLKEYLVNMELDTDKVMNKYMLEIIADVEKRISQMTSGVKELADGSQEFDNNLQEYIKGINDMASGIEELSNGYKTFDHSIKDLNEGSLELSEAGNSLHLGLDEINTNSDALLNAANEVFEKILLNTEGNIRNFGLDVSLTKENYSENLNNLYNQLNAIGSEQVKNVLELTKQLDGYRLFYESLTEYANGVKVATNAANRIRQGAKTINNASVSLSDGSTEILDGIDELVKGSNDITTANTDLIEGSADLLEGSRKLKDEVDVFVEEELDIQYENLITFLEADNNLRITNHLEDAKINKAAALIVGMFFMLLIAFILSVFVVQNVDRDRAIIGTLYSMGYIKKELLRNFMLLPVMIVGIGSVFGTLLAYLLIPVLAEENSSAFSYPPINTVYKPYLMIFGIVLPMIFTILVNFRVLNKRLSQEPLKLLRKEIKTNYSNSLRLERFSFINCYRIRQFLREIRLNITLFLGLFLAIMILMMGFSTKGSIEYYIDNATKDMDYNYLYLLKYPPKEIPVNGEASYLENLVTDFTVTGGVIDVTIQGVIENGIYFPEVQKLSKNEIYISTSAVEKLGLKKGENVILTDNINGNSYKFKIAGIINFTNGLYVFMNLDHMREVFNKEPDYFNTVMSMSEINIEEGRIQSIISVDSVNDACSQFISLMEGTISLLIFMPILVFIITMYLLIKLMIDKSTFSISLVKVLGYSKTEIKKLYLGGSWYVVLFSSFVAVPICKLIMNFLFPYMISNFSSGMKVYVSLPMYIQIFAIIYGTYLVVNFILSKHLKKISLVEILKGRE